MHRVAYALAALTLFGGACSTGPANPPAFSDQPQPLSGPAMAFRNGHWFNGETFIDRTMYSVNGMFTVRKPSRVDSVMDLNGGYVVPPFADAHNHNVEFYTAPRLAALLAKYLREGVFYDQNPDNLFRARPGLTGFVNVATGIDATFSNGGLTASGGHPTGLFLRNLKAGIFSAADGDGGMLWYVDSVSDLDRKWPAILAQKPDFIKTFLLYSEEYLARRDDSVFFNWRGLNPALLPEIVRRAHAAGLRVMTHIETAADFHSALLAGSDEIAHIPGFRGDEHGQLPDLERFAVLDADAALAAERRVVVVTTLAGSATAYSLTGADSILRHRFDSLNIRNLRTLNHHGVVLAIGSDDYRSTSVPEATYLHSLSVFSNLELLKMWSETTPAAIFPGRRIGVLQSDYEASFLVLAGNPLVDFANTGRINLRVKQGRQLVPTQ